MLSRPQPRQVEIVHQPIEIPAPKIPLIPLPLPVDLVPVEWEILSGQDFTCEGDFVFISLSPSGYENLSRNQAELLRYVKEAVYQLDYYRRVISDASQESGQELREVGE